MIMNIFKSAAPNIKARTATRGALAVSASALAAFTAATFGGPAQAQWQDTTARPPEAVTWYGDPSAPNMSGVWVLDEKSGASGSKEGWKPWPVPLKGAFAETYKKRTAPGAPSADPTVGCMPPGMPRFITDTKVPLLIIQSKNRVTLYHDGEAPRRIWLDGRPLPAPADTEPFLKGTNIGHYEGSDLVTDSFGFKDQPIDSTGVPHSDKLEIKERYHRVDDQTLQVTVTLTDPLAYSRPLTTTVTYKALKDPQWEPHEFLCTPNTDYHPERYVH